MVERKKTGLAKARKRVRYIFFGSSLSQDIVFQYAWVKR